LNPPDISAETAGAYRSGKELQLAAGAASLQQQSPLGSALPVGLIDAIYFGQALFSH
jgi:hypothetical protein